MVVKTAGCSPVFTVPVVLLLLSFHWSYVQSACLSSCPSNACSSQHNRNAGYCANVNYVQTTSQQAYYVSESYGEYYRIRCTKSGGIPCLTYQIIRYRSVTRYRTTYHSTLRCTTSCCSGYSGVGINCQPVCSPGCSNGGTCTAPSRCSCTPQWTGPTCTTDVNECTAHTHNCEQLCANTPGGFTCSCNSGYQLLGNRYQCQDVNECTTGTHNCEQLCTNTPGGFTCSCLSRYQLLNNGYQCQAPPSSVSISGSSNVEYTQTLSLTCSASGIVDDYKWYRNNNKLINITSHSYLKSSAQLSDSGSYRCVACNWAGCTSSSSYAVTIIEGFETAGLAVGVALGMLLAVLMIAIVVIFVLLICKKCQCSKTKKTDPAAVYNVNKNGSGNPMETVQLEPAYGGEDYTLTDNPRYVNEHLKMSRDPHCVSVDRVTSQEQHYASLDLKSVQTSAYTSLTFNQNSSTAISKYGDSTDTTKKYNTPKKVVPQKKPSTQQTHEYINWNVISQQHGEGEQSSIDRKSFNKIPSTSGPGVKEVGKEATAPRKSQVFTSDVTMPTKKEKIGETGDLILPEKHEQREKVPPPTKQRPKTNKKQPLLPPTQESATPKPQARPQQPNPVMTGSPSYASPKPPIASKAKKQPLLPKKVPPEQSAVTKQPPPEPNVTELRKIYIFEK